jgi:hypothetical protein
MQPRLLECGECRRRPVSCPITVHETPSASAPAVIPPGHDWCPACEQVLPLAAFKRDRRKAVCCVLSCWDCSSICSERRHKESSRRRHRGDPPYRELVLDHYGRSCRCCSVTEQLTIDHVNGDGAEHRKTVNGAQLYRWLVENDFPEGFQTLCFNCNASKRAGPRCLLDHSVPGKPRRRTPAELRRLRATGML